MSLALLLIRGCHSLTRMNLFSFCTLHMNYRGLIGPNRQFGTGSIYHPQLYAIIIGALLPLPFWLWQRRHPESWIRYVSTPIILNGVSFIPPATGINYSSWFAVGFIFQYLIRRRNFGWWSKFNYVTSAALDSGTVISLIFIFFTLQVSLTFFIERFAGCFCSDGVLFFYLVPERWKACSELVGE